MSGDGASRKSIPPEIKAAVLELHAVYPRAMAFDELVARACARRIEAITRSKMRRLEAIRATIRERPRTVTEIADELFTRAVVRFQRNFAMAEALAHIAYLRWQGQVERRIRPDGIYEWYPTEEGERR